MRTATHLKQSIPPIRASIMYVKLTTSAGRAMRQHQTKEPASKKVTKKEDFPKEDLSKLFDIY
jgi:hypothetical protein